MCQACYDAAMEYLPDYTDEEQYAVLMNYTAYPYGSAAYIRAQLAEYAADPAGAGARVEAAYREAFADEE